MAKPLKFEFAGAPIEFDMNKVDRSKLYGYKEVEVLDENGDTCDFLFGMAKDLEEKESMILLGGGPQSNQPLILRRGSSPYRGFLEGRTQGDKYCLLLHLSNLELKTPEKQPPEPSLQEDA